MSKKKIGIISDTHGLLRDEVKALLKDVDLIIHAGDIGKEQILNELKLLSKTVVVKGNVDTGEWANDIPLTNLIEIDNLKIYVIHNIKELKINPKDLGINIVIYGHSHKQKTGKADEVLYINPGSAGPKRFNLTASIAILKIFSEKIDIEIKCVS